MLLHYKISNTKKNRRLRSGARSLPTQREVSGSIIYRRIFYVSLVFVMACAIFSGDPFTQLVVDNGKPVSCVVQSNFLNYRALTYKSKV